MKKYFLFVYLIFISSGLSAQITYWKLTRIEYPNNASHIDSTLYKGLLSKNWHIQLNTEKGTLKMLYPVWKSKKEEGLFSQLLNKKLYDYTFGNEILHDSCLFIGMQNNRFRIETAMVHPKNQIKMPYKWIFEQQTPDISSAEINKLIRKDSIAKLPRIYLIPENFNGKFLRIVYEEPSGSIPETEKDKRLFAFPKDGVLVLRIDFDYDEDYTNDEYYFVGKTGVRKRIMNIYGFTDSKKELQYPAMLVGHVSRMMDETSYWDKHSKMNRLLACVDFTLYRSGNNKEAFTKEDLDIESLIIKKVKASRLLKNKRNSK